MPQPRIHRVRILPLLCGSALLLLGVLAPTDAATKTKGKATPKTSPTPASSKSKLAKATPKTTPQATPKTSPKTTPKPSPAASPKPKKTKAATPGATPKPANEADKKDDAADAGAAAKTSAVVDPAAPPPEKVPADRNASLTSDELVEFQAQPEPVKKLIETALALTRQNLTYAYGSADPASGGLDCSGFIYHVLRQHGFNDVPRQANEQYVWVRKAREFDAVLTKKKQGFEFDDLKPGDLLFWTGTYSIDRDPPVTHTMLYLGTEKSTKQAVMAGSSDGRTYRGKSRWGVSVFDFQGGQTSRDPAKQGRGGFVGYATIPGLRD